MADSCFRFRSTWTPSARPGQPGGAKQHLIECSEQSLTTTTVTIVSRRLRTHSAAQAALIALASSFSLHLLLLSRLLRC